MVFTFPILFSFLISFFFLSSFFLKIVGEIEYQNKEKGELRNVFEKIYTISEKDNKSIKDLYLVLMNGEDTNETYGDDSKKKHKT